MSHPLRPPILIGKIRKCCDSVGEAFEPLDEALRNGEETAQGGVENSLLLEVDPMIPLGPIPTNGDRLTNSAPLVIR